MGTTVRLCKSTQRGPIVSEERERTVQEMIQLGQLGLQMGYWQEAEAYFERALRLAPAHSEALLGKALACRDPRRALDAVRALLAVEPDSAEGLRLEAELLERLGEAPGTPRDGYAPSAEAAPASAAQPRNYFALLLAGMAVALLALLVMSTRLGLFSQLRQEPAVEMAPSPSLADWVTPGVDAEWLSQALAATVAIRVFDPSGLWEQWGSGVMVDAQGLVLTNYHVLADAQQRLLNPEGLAFVGLASDVRQPPDRWYIAAPLALDPARDLAVLCILADGQGRSVQGERFVAVALREGEDLALGDPLIGLGYPALGGETLTLTRGSMAGFAYSVNDIRLGKTDSELLPGSSGGAVLDPQGRLAGIITATVTEARTQGRLGYFVLVGEAAELLDAARQASRPAPSLRWMRELFLAGGLGR